MLNVTRELLWLEFTHMVDDALAATFAPVLQNVSSLESDRVY